MSNGKAEKVSANGGFKKCEVCGYKVRGSNHNEGSHHNKGKKGKS